MVIHSLRGIGVDEIHPLIDPASLRYRTGLQRSECLWANFVKFMLNGMSIGFGTTNQFCYKLHVLGLFSTTAPSTRQQAGRLTALATWCQWNFRPANSK